MYNKVERNMANKKLEIKATEDQIQTLYESLKAGAPLTIALQRARISVPTFYYWVAIASIVVAVKNQEEIEELEAIAQSGVSIQEVREMATYTASNSKGAIASFVEPSGESILKYKNSKRFRNFADRCYEIVNECNHVRSDFVALQLLRISQSTQKKNGVNPSGAMWWLERNLPELYAKPSEKAKNEETDQSPQIPSVQVEFISPEGIDSKQRLIDMEKEILDGYKKKEA